MSCELIYKLLTHLKNHTLPLLKWNKTGYARPLMTLINEQKFKIFIIDVSYVVTAVKIF